MVVYYSLPSQLMLQKSLPRYDTGKYPILWFYKEVSVPKKSPKNRQKLRQRLKKCGKVSTKLRIIITHILIHLLDGLDE